MPAGIERFPRHKPLRRPTAVDPANKVRRFVVIGTKHVEIGVMAESPQAAARAFARMTPGTHVDAITDRDTEEEFEVRGQCEGCGLPILVGEEYDSYSDGVITHHGDCPAHGRHGVVAGRRP